MPGDATSQESVWLAIQREHAAAQGREDRVRDAKSAWNIRFREQLQHRAKQDSHPAALQRIEREAEYVARSFAATKRAQLDTRIRAARRVSDRTAMDAMATGQSAQRQAAAQQRELSEQQWQKAWARRGDASAGRTGKVRARANGNRHPDGHTYTDSARTNAQASRRQADLALQAARWDKQQALASAAQKEKLDGRERRRRADTQAGQ
jgi:hypothetical protein